MSGENWCITEQLLASEGLPAIGLMILSLRQNTNWWEEQWWGRNWEGYGRTCLRSSLRCQSPKFSWRDCRNSRRISLMKVCPGRGSNPAPPPALPVTPLGSVRSHHPAPRTAAATLGDNNNICFTSFFISRRRLTDTSRVTLFLQEACETDGF
jgi:hypothetical protein